MKKAGDQPGQVEITDRLPEKARRSGDKTGEAGAKAGGSRAKAAEKRKVSTVFIGNDANLWATEPIDVAETLKTGVLKRTNDADAKKKSAAAGARSGSSAKSSGGTAKSGRNDAKSGTKASAKRAKAKKPNEKITPASIFKKMISFGKNYQVENEQDFLEAARIYAEEAGLIDQMRDKLAEDGLTVLKTYKTGDVEVAHPLLSELPRHVESANKCLTTISNMISERGAKVEKAKRDLDAFRLH